MKVNEEQYWELVNYIENSNEEVIGFQIEEFDEEDFSDWCQIMRRLQGDTTATVTLQFFLCPDCGQLHGLIEARKEQ